MPSPKHAWITKSTFEDKPWGSARFWHASNGFHGKVITIHARERTSMKYHNMKNEFFYVLSGMVKVRFGSSKTLSNESKYPWEEAVLNEGDVFNVQAGCPYRFHALQESVIIEVGDRASDDPVRIEDDYGRIDVKQS
jgi:mannose-6-phosphate isomerase-like protein (cupin superfamily)